MLKQFLADVAEYQKARAELDAVTDQPLEAIQMAVELMKMGIRAEDVESLIRVRNTGILRLASIDWNQFEAIMDAIRKLRWAIGD